MWHTLRAELDYVRPWLLGGLGIALVLTVLNTAIWAIVGGPPPFAAAGIRAMFPVLGTMIVAFIAQAFRNQERRARLYLAGPITPRQLAVVSVLIPVALCAFGTVVAAVFFAVESAVIGAFELETLNLAGYVGGQLLLYAQMGLLIQEAVICSRQHRRGGAVAGWATLIAATILFALVTIAAFAYQGPWTWPVLHAGNLVGAGAAMVVTIRLFSGRNDFTR